MNVYISGAITGQDDYKERFGRAAEIVRETGKNVIYNSLGEVVQAHPELTREHYK